MSFGENLQYLRSESGTTQEQLAERLEVSRQSVSKWESDSSFPEMDKLLALCEIYHCDLDTLLRGDVRAARQADTAGYDAHMNRFSGMMAAGAVLTICGFSAGGLLEALLKEERWGGAAFLLFALLAAVVFIIGGMQHRDFCEHHAHIEPFYDEKTLAAWRQRYPIFIAGGVAACIGGILLMCLLEGIMLGNLPAGASEDVISSIGLLLVAAGVGLLAYGGVQNDKYRIEAFNRERENEKSPLHRRIERIHGAILLAATAAFLVYWYFWAMQGWESERRYGIGLGALLIFGLGGLLCAAVSALLNKDGKN